jgi:hypothetical protein
MKTFIYCVPTQKGIHSFYLVNGNQKFYLFSQKYRKGVQSYYSKGVFLDKAIDFSKARSDSAVERTMSKIPGYVRYIENAYGIEILEQTKRRNRERKRAA